MKRIRANFQRLRGLLCKRRLELEMQEEIRAHLEALTERYRSSGLSAREACLAALREFGGVEQIKELCREHRSWLGLEQLAQDIRMAIRMLAKNWTFTAAILVTLALGIGLTTSMFSVIYGVLLHPYCYENPQEIWAPEIVGLNGQQTRTTPFPLSEFQLLSGLPCVDIAAAIQIEDSVIASGRDPEILTGARVSISTFQFLGVKPILGRTLGSSDLRAGGEPEPVVVIAYHMWQRRFGGDPSILGKSITLDGTPHIVVGVMPPRFAWGFIENGYWRPLEKLDTSNVQVWTNVRLKKNVTLPVANEQLASLFRRWAERDPSRAMPDGVTVRFRRLIEIAPASSQMRTSIYLLSFGVGFLLLIACSNVANLQLARGTSRAREIAIRFATGATRARVIRQLLTESGVTSFLGGGLGIAVAYGLTATLVALMPHFFPNETVIQVNGEVLAFCFGISLLVGIGSGLAPAFSCTRLDLNSALKEGGQSVTSHRQALRMRNGLVALEVALSILLVLGAGLATRGFIETQRISLTLDPRRLLLLNLPLSPHRYPTTSKRIEFARELVARMRVLPGVIAAEVGTNPGKGELGFSTFSIATDKSLSIRRGIAVGLVGAQFRRTVGIGLRAGRDFTDAEVSKQEPVALINRSAAEAWGKTENAALDQLIELHAFAGPGKSDNLPAEKPARPFRVIGITTDLESDSVKRHPPTIFVPYTWRGVSLQQLVVRTEKAPESLLSAIRGEIKALDPEQPMYPPRTAQELIQLDGIQPRFTMALLAGVALVALVLAGGGIYNVLAYQVQQRTREIGVRMALGAQGGDILRLIVGSVGRVVVLGFIIGIVAGGGLMKLVSSQVFGLPALDPFVFGAALSILAGAAVLACYLPCRRATRISPLDALRSD